MQEPHPDITREVLLAPRGPRLHPATRVIERDGWYQVVTPGCRDEDLNEVIQAKGPDPQRFVRETLAQYAALELPCKWCVMPDSSASLPDMLAPNAARTWRAAGMFVETSRIVPSPDDVQVTIVKDGRDLEDYCDVVSAGWGGTTWSDRTRLRAAVESGARALFLARWQDQPAGAAALVRWPESVYLTGAVTLPDFRGRGVYRATVAARLAMARRDGVALATTHARCATSAPILERLGFQTAFAYDLFAFEPPGLSTDSPQRGPG